MQSLHLDQMAFLRLLLLVALSAPLALAQSTPVYDVIVIGAGVSGLKAAFDLRQAGRSVLVLEARTRPYGRIDTQQPAGWPIPIEVNIQLCCCPLTALNWAVQPCLLLVLAQLLQDWRSSAEFPCSPWQVTLP
jgi:hypothetical protein